MKRLTTNKVIAVYMIVSSILLLSLLAGMIYEATVLQQVYTAASDANNTAQDAVNYASSADSNAQDASNKADSICNAISGCY